MQLIACFLSLYSNKRLRKMGKRIYILFSFFVWSSLSFAAHYQIKMTNHSFSPSSITIQLGDTIHFELDSNQRALEISYEAWMNNRIDAKNGFYTENGGGEVIPNQTGTFYYCNSNLRYGFTKGQIIVKERKLETQENHSDDLHAQFFNIFPNPCSEYFEIQMHITFAETGTLEIVNDLGETMFKRLLPQVNGQSYRVNTKDYIPGIYWLLIRCDKKVFLKRIVKN